MELKQRYEKDKKKLLTNDSICEANRQLYKDFFQYEEYKLLRTNNLRKLDKNTYKTLLSYLSRIKNINKWFKNKPLKDITKKEIKQVYDDLEDGKIRTQYNKPFKDRRSYYNKIFKSKLFNMIGKDEIAKEVLEYYKPNSDVEVRFVKEEDVKRLVNVIIKPEHKLLTWLSFDIGENINSLLELKKGDCIKETEEETKTQIYNINLRKETLKRSRKPRTEPTNYQETVELLNILLQDKKNDDKLFAFGYASAKKFLDRAVRITKVKCIPRGQKPTWKDLRSGMACDLLKKGWTRDEINARLGHKPSSSEIDKYINFTAIERKVPQRKIYQNNLQKLQLKVEQTEERERLQAKRVQNNKKSIEKIEPLMDLLYDLGKDNPKFKKLIEELKSK